MEIYIHDAEAEDPSLIEVEPGSPVRELVLVEGKQDCLIWIEEQEEPLVLDITFEQAGVAHRHHLHRGRCRQVEVRVRFNAVTHNRHFPPSGTIGRVYKWASGPEAFDLTPEQRADHMLAVPGADHGLDSAVHVGSLVRKPVCEVDLDLVPRGRFQG